MSEDSFKAFRMIHIILAGSFSDFKKKIFDDICNADDRRKLFFIVCSNLKFQFNS
jgi:hypothetical protein